MSTFLFVESNTTGTGQLAVARLTARGHRVVFITRERSKYPFLDAAGSRLRVVDAETNDPAQLTATVARLRREAGGDALVTFSDFYVAIVAEVAASLGFRYLAPRPAAICRSKFLTREALARHGLPTPEYRLLASESDAVRLGGSLRFPCVVKPPADSSSFGVRVVADAHELLAQFRGLSALTTNVRGQRLDGSVLVESYLDGPELSVETFSLPGGAVKVVGVTDKHLSPLPHCVELGHDFPSQAPAAVQQAVTGAALRGLQAVGFDFGPAHTEVRWTARGPVIVEINPRLAGGMIPEIVRYATGTDLLDALLELQLGGSAPRLEARRRDVAAVRFLTASRAGRIAEVRGLEQARAVPGVREVAFAKAVGARVRPAENAYHRLGFVIASGPEPLLVLAAADRARNLIAIDIEAEAEADSPAAPEPPAVDPRAVAARTLRPTRQSRGAP